MKQWHVKKGFALIVLILMAFIMSILVGIALRNTIFFHDIVLKKQIYSQQVAVAEGLLRYGVAIALNSYDYLFSDQLGPYEVVVGAWPSPEDHLYDGRICIEKQGNGLYVQAFLKNDDMLAYSASCLVTPQKGTHHKEIQNWSVEGKKTV